MTVNISKGKPFAPAYLAIAPNNRMPEIVDHAPADGGAPLALFESGEILLSLAEKSARFLPAELRGRHETLQWLFWQTGGPGAMAGQNHHFAHDAPGKLPHAIERYFKETQRLYGALERRLVRRDFISGDCSIADMAAYPWCLLWPRQAIELAGFPNIGRWLERIGARPATQRAYARGKALNTVPTITEDSKQLLFGQGRR